MKIKGVKMIRLLGLATLCILLGTVSTNAQDINRHMIPVPTQYFCGDKDYIYDNIHSQEGMELLWTGDVNRPGGTDKTVVTELWVSLNGGMWYFIGSLKNQKEKACVMAVGSKWSPPVKDSGKESDVKDKDKIEKKS